MLLIFVISQINGIGQSIEDTLNSVRGLFWSTT